MAAIHPCPKCKRAMIPVGVAYCDKCKPLVETRIAESRERKAAAKAKAYNKKRDPKYVSFYRSKDWKVTSRAKLQSVGYKCEAGLDGCTRLAVEVHHVKPIRTEEGWNRRLDWSNLEALCTSCHNKRHGNKFKKKSEDYMIDLKNFSTDPGGTSKSF